jgi:transcription-repair coupling factor (superfamily II helicase)
MSDLPAAFAPHVSTNLVDRLLDTDGFRAIASAMEAGRSASIDGAWGSSIALVLAALSQRLAVPAIVICPSIKTAETLLDDLPFFGLRDLQYFPAWETAPGDRLVYDEIYGDRLRTLKRLMSYAAPALVVTSIQSLLQPVPPREAVIQNTRRLRTGDVVDLENLAQWLATHGFHATSGVELPGEFSLRGGILDLFGPDWNLPTRIELFGDQIESIREFEVTAQRSIRQLKEVDVTILPAGGNDPMRAAEDASHLASYLPDNSWFALCEPEQIQQEARQYLQHQSAGQELLGLTETMSHVVARGNVAISGLAQAPAADSMRFSVEAVERFTGNLDELKADLDKADTQREYIIVCPTEAEATRLQEVLGNTALASEGRLHFAQGFLTNGFHWVDQHVVLVSGAELVQRRELRRKSRRHLGKRIDSFLDLRPGDLVVHLSHGVARFRGMQVLQRENQVEEHLVLEFAEQTKIYVPASKIDLVQKYIGSGKARPTLAKIGGTAWAKRKKEAELAVTDMAVELLEVQARRRALPGIAQGADTDWQREFDASFPYEETPDQLAAIESIKTDMEAPRPMDRLLCGDVGFGKTEVAMRAAFKAVDNGYQVAVLVPTTILAEQHYHTFRERIAEFPFHIAKLSRFCSAKEQRETLKKLELGEVDIVIGTHRLASTDVKFHNLGLLIIDEEQRFGVEVKERLKSMRSMVDVLTMTATPIPRTLHMSMTGLRDISNLETPPDDRIAVETRLARWNDDLIRHAIVRELDRGGQVYFVHNRVNDIEVVKKKLQRIVPEALIQVGHGQMHEQELEQVMVEFVQGKFDVLLATTIVESGLDIPNANTIFVDESHRYGLADLHQLRGRVGRYRHRAYCYLLIDKHKHITPDAARRLRAIEEFSHMGAGFAIAMRDLEFRGAGNVLGTQQSGHISAVGYELYCQMLENAVRHLRRLPPQISLDTNVDLPCQAYLPVEYVPEQRARIDLYRRLTRVSSPADLETLVEELQDRFGAIPEPANHLIQIASLRMDAAVWRIATIRLENNFLVFDYTDKSRITQLSKLHQRKLRIVDDRSAYWPLNQLPENPDQILKLVQSVLRP